MGSTLSAPANSYPFSQEKVRVWAANTVQPPTPVSTARGVLNASPVGSHAPPFRTPPVPGEPAGCRTPGGRQPDVQLVPSPAPSRDTPGLPKVDGSEEWSPRDTVYKKWPKEEPLLYSTTASTFVTPRTRGNSQVSDPNAARRAPSERSSRGVPSSMTSGSCTGGAVSAGDSSAWSRFSLLPEEQSPATDIGSSSDFGFPAATLPSPPVPKLSSPGWDPQEDDMDDLNNSFGLTTSNTTGNNRLPFTFGGPDDETPRHDMHNNGNIDGRSSLMFQSGSGQIDNIPDASSGMRSSLGTPMLESSLEAKARQMDDGSSWPANPQGPRPLLGEDGGFERDSSLCGIRDTSPRAPEQMGSVRTMGSRIGQDADASCSSPRPDPSIGSRPSEEVPQEPVHAEQGGWHSWDPTVGIKIAQSLVSPDSPRLFEGRVCGSMSEASNLESSPVNSQTSPDRPPSPCPGSSSDRGSLRGLVGRFGRPIDAGSDLRDQPRPMPKERKERQQEQPEERPSERQAFPLQRRTSDGRDKVSESAGSGSCSSRARGSGGATAGQSGTSSLTVHTRVPVPRKEARPRSKNSRVGSNADEDKWARQLAFKEENAGLGGGDFELSVMEEAANAIEMRDLAEIRSFRHASTVVTHVCEVTFGLLGLPLGLWSASRTKLDSTLLQKLVCFDREAAATLKREQVQVIQQTLKLPIFKDAISKERQRAVAPLARWCRAAGNLLMRLHGDLTLSEDRDAPQRLPLVSRSNSRQRTPLESPATTVDCGSPRDDRGYEASWVRGPWNTDGARSSAPSPQRHISPGRSKDRVNPQVGHPYDLGGLYVEPELWRLTEEQLARVEDLRIGREGVGEVTFHGETDCRDLLPQIKDSLVIEQGEVVVYPDAATKPPVGEGLNKAASVVLFGCMPNSQQRLLHPTLRERYRQRVAQMTEKKGAVFEDYDCEKGTWKFRVDHF